MRCKILLLSMIALGMLMCPSASATSETVVSTTEKYHPNAYEPDPYMKGNVTIGTHKGAMGTSILSYIDNGGETRVLPFEVITTYINPTKFISPHALQAPILSDTGNKTNWTAAANWNITNNDATTASIDELITNGVPRIKLVFDANDTNVSNATFSFLVTKSDYSKDEFLLGLEIVDLDDADTGMTIRIGVHDDDGDRYDYLVKPGMTLNHRTTIGNTEGTTSFHQTTILDLNYTEDGDGTFDGIDSIQITFIDNNADNGSRVELRIYAMGLYIKPFSFGTKANGIAIQTMNATSSSLMKIPIYNPSFKHTECRDFGPIEFKARASQLAAKDSYINWTSLNSSAGYVRDFKREIEYRFNMSVPNQQELTYSDMDLVYLTTVSTEYVRKASVNGVRKTTLIKNAWKGDKIVLSSGLTQGTVYHTMFDIMYTEAELTDIEVTEDPINRTPLIKGKPDSLVNKIAVAIAVLFAALTGGAYKQRTDRRNTPPGGQ